MSGSGADIAILSKEETELQDNLSGLVLRDNLSQLLSELARAEAARDSKEVSGLAAQIQEIHGQMRALEEKRKML